MSVKQNLFVSVFVHKCLIMLYDVEYTTFKMFVTQISNYLFDISFQFMFYKTLRYRLARAYMGRNLSTDLSRPKLKLIRPSKVSPLLEMITAGLCFRIQWILWRLLGINLLAIAKTYTRSTSFVEH